MPTLGTVVKQIISLLGEFGSLGFQRRYWVNGEDPK